MTDVVTTVGKRNRRGVPQLTVRYLVVKPREGAVVYCPSGSGFIGPLPEEWTACPISPDLMMAINSGDLEQAGPDDLPPAPPA